MGWRKERKGVIQLFHKTIRALERIIIRKKCLIDYEIFMKELKEHIRQEIKTHIQEQLGLRNQESKNA